MKKLSLDHLDVSSFEPVAPPAKKERAKEEEGTVYGFSGVYGPDCPSQWPNCNRYTG